MFTWRLLLLFCHNWLRCFLKFPLFWFVNNIFIVRLTLITRATIYVALSSFAFRDFFWILKQSIKVNYFLLRIVHIDPACFDCLYCYFVMLEPVEVGSESLYSDLGAFEAGLSFLFVFVDLWLSLWIINHKGSIVDGVFEHLRLLIAYILAKCFVSCLSDFNEFFLILNWHQTEVALCFFTLLPCLALLCANHHFNNFGFDLVYVVGKSVAFDLKFGFLLWFDFIGFNLASQNVLMLSAYCSMVHFLNHFQPRVVWVELHLLLLFLLVEKGVVLIFAFFLNYQLLHIVEHTVWK